MNIPIQHVRFFSLRIIIFAAALSLLAGAGAAQAQDFLPEPLPEHLRVYSVSELPAADGLTVQVTFGLVDRFGTPYYGGEKIDNAWIHLLGQPSEPITVTQSLVGAEIPYEIVLVVDASGSVSSTLGAVKDALRGLILDMFKSPALPTGSFVNVRLKLIVFSDRVQSETDFTGDAGTLSARIDRIEAQSGTCLYDALRDAAGALYALRPEGEDVAPKQQAIVVFTDGWDTCPSGTTKESLLAMLRQEGNIPIYSVALNPGNINSADLVDLARQTTGQPLQTENPGELPQFFQEILANLRTRLMRASATLYPNQAGSHNAALLLEVEDVSRKLSTTFSFESPEDYKPPLPPVNVRLFEPYCNYQEQTCSLKLAISGMEAVSQTFAHVIGPDGQIIRTLAGSDEWKVPYADSAELVINSANFQPGGKYQVKVYATDGQGNYVARTGNIGSTDDPLVLAQSEFQYAPPPPTPLPKINFVVLGCSVKYRNLTPNILAADLVVTLDLLSGVTNKGVHYEWFVLDASKQPLIIDQGTLSGSTVLTGTLPHAFVPGEALDIRVRLTPALGDATEAVLEGCVPDVPPRLGWFQRLISSLEQNSWLLYSMVAVVASSLAIWTFRRAQPALVSLVKVAPAKPQAIDTVRVSLLDPSGRTPVKQWIVDSANLQRSPWRIGRLGSGAQIEIDSPNLQDDHANLRLSAENGGKIQFQDNSLDCYLLPSNQPARTITIERSIMIRLGQNTIIRIEPLSHGPI